MRGRVLPLRRVEGTTEALSDAALVAACASGDAAALGALFDRHHRAVYRFISRLSLAEASEVDDLVQTTFLTVQRSARSYQGRSAVLSWIFGIAVNTTRRAARSRGRRRRLLQAVEAQPLPSGAPLDEAVARRRAVQRLGEALATLPEKTRACFVMCQLEGISGPEAAAALGMRTGTVYRRIHEARAALRGVLGEGA